jgi:hypothetical protein
MNVYYLFAQANTDIVSHSFNWVNYMTEIGSTVSSATVSECTNTIIISNVFTSNNVVSFNTTGGVPGSSYMIVNDIMTINGQSITAKAILAISSAC